MESHAARYFVCCAAVWLMLVPGALAQDGPVGRMTLGEALGPLTSPEGTTAPLAGSAAESDLRKEDEKKQEKLAKAAAGAYKGVFYDNDFSYLEDPDFHDTYLGDRLKRMPLADDWVLDLGGQYRLRTHNENNIRGLGLTGRDDDFVLHRWRLYANLEWQGKGRVYVEYLDAQSNGEDFPPRTIEENRSDLLNAFADAELWSCECGKLWGRVGRQELLYGAQRLVSPLDWGNTRRTFDGAKLFWRGECWDLDAFWTQPVFPLPRSFDNPDSSQDFSGLYATYKKLPRGPVDFYYLRYEEHQGAPNFDFNTVGLRHAGDWCDWLWDLEGAYQFGEFGAANVSAGFYTIGIGRRFAECPWKPSVWAYYDWASGDDNRGAGFHHLFPLVHRYLGYMDLFGRRNIEDWNFQFNVEPCKCLNVQVWYHIFHLENGNDVPYAVNMAPAPVGLPVTPGGSRDLGQEIDFLVTWRVSDRAEWQFGYSHFWSGDWFATNPTPGLFRGNADFYYMQTHINF